MIQNLATDNNAVPNSVSFWQALGFWFKLGFISFGGPAGQIAIIHEELVVRRRWISENVFCMRSITAWFCRDLRHNN